MGQSQHLIYWAGRVRRYSYMLIYKIIWVMHAFWVVLAYDLWDVQYHSKVGWQVLKNWSLILDPQFSILDSWKTVRMEAWVKFQDVQVEYQDPQNSVLFSAFLVFFLVVSKGIKSRLCSSGARSPQATNIWSWNEKEKRSPVRVHRFRLVWKPETKPANV